MAITIDVTSAEHDKKNGGGLPTAGEHVMYMSHCEHVFSAAGNLYIKCDYTLCNRDDNDNGKAVKYQAIFLTAKSIWWLVDLCRAIDGKMDPFDAEQPDEFASAIVGKPFVGTIVHYDDTYQGTTRKKLKLGAVRLCREDEGQNLDIPDQSNAYDQPVGEDDIPF